MFSDTRDVSDSAGVLEGSGPTGSVGVLDRLARAAMELVPGGEAATVELLAGSDRLVRLGGAGTAVEAVGAQSALGDSLSGLAVRGACPVVCDDADLDPRHNVRALRFAGIRSMLCVPLQRDAAVVGALTVCSSRPKAFEASATRVLTEVAGFAGSIVAATTETDQQMLSGSETLLTAGERARIDRFVTDMVEPGADERLEIDQRIRRVLDHRDIDLVFQPIIDLRSGRAMAYEALARFTGPPKQPPDIWFHDAEAVGLGLELEMAAFRGAISALPMLPASASLCVNLGPEAIVQCDLGLLLRGLDLSRIIIEVTEHNMVTDYTEFNAKVRRLRSVGIRLSVDDIGAGYSCMSHVLNLAPEFIKLDMALTRGIDTDPARRALTAALVSFGHETGASIVAEGIETIQELQTIKELGTDLGQGYYLGRPANIPLGAQIAGWASTSCDASERGSPRAQGLGGPGDSPRYDQPS